MHRLKPFNLATCIAGFAALSLGGCIGYHAEPLDPAAVQRDYAARTLTNPELLTFVDHSASPPATWDMDRLTRAALYYHPDITTARAHVAAVQAAQKTAGES